MPSSATGRQSLEDESTALLGSVRTHSPTTERRESFLSVCGYSKPYYLRSLIFRLRCGFLEGSGVGGGRGYVLCALRVTFYRRTTSHTVKRYLRDKLLEFGPPSTKSCRMGVRDVYQVGSNKCSEIYVIQMSHSPTPTPIQYTPDQYANNINKSYDHP